METPPVQDPGFRPRDWPVYRVGLTGGIASGKSTVAGMFAALGIPVIDTDVIARDVVLPGTAGLEAIVAAFGPDVLLPDGSLDRRRLRALVFDDPVRRRHLEAILHPRIRSCMEALGATSGGPYQVLVIPLLLESDLDGRVDRVLVVDCSEEVQRERLMVRDGESAAAADRILAVQLGRQARLDRADDVLLNAGSRDQLQRRVRDLHATYLNLARALNRGGVKGSA